jgi:hypothetical protein
VAERPIALPPVTRERAMTITPFLDGERFDLEGERVLRLAFEMVCLALKTGDCDDYVKQAIATKLITRIAAWRVASISVRRRPVLVIPVRSQYPHPGCPNRRCGRFKNASDDCSVSSDDVVILIAPSPGANRLSLSE